MLNREDFINSIRKMTEIDQITMDSTFEECGLDSTAVVELLIDLEVKYNIDLLDDHFDPADYVTVEDAYHYVERIVMKAT